MKKFLLFIAFVFMGSFFLNAQSNFRFGIQTSPTFTWLSTDNKDINGNGSNLGFKLGLIGEIDINESYSFVSGINFGFNHGGTLKYNKGGKYWPTVTDDDLPDGVNLKYNIQMIEIPFGMKMKTNEFGLFRYYAELPIFTIGIISKSTGDIKGTANSNRSKENIADELKALSIAWGFGAGVEYEISSSTKLVGGLGFQQYFLDFTENNGTVDGGEKDDSKAGMGGLTIKIGVIF